MKTLRTALFLVALLPFFAFGNGKPGFTITGFIKGLNTGMVELTYRNLSGDDTTITANVTSGQFTFTGHVPEPELARFNVHTGWAYSVSFFLENTPITFNMVKDDDDRTTITGSPSNIVYHQLEPQLRAFFANARNYDNNHQRAIDTGNPAGAIIADSIWSAQLQQWIHTIRTTIAAQPKNYAGLYFIQWLFFHPPAYDTLRSLFMQLSPVVRNGPAGKAFSEQLQQMHRIATGQPAPEVTGSDTSGHPVTLASLKGQIVLLDFWASYCSICRSTNPQLKATYEKYHAAGFQVLSVSLDYQRNAWIGAIQADKLTWPQISEIRGGAAASAATYDVHDLPRNWLIDQHGNILAHDLSITELNKKLSELLSKK